ncbi:MAG: hypothetical protein U9R34_04445 [Nanoarchaeota archaeon]|nr:hypothetical protein [Nanoarchaeota archaeon]
MRRREKSNRYGKFIAILVGLVMIGSIAGYVVLDSGSKTELEYNGYEFRQDKNGFSTEIEEKVIAFNFHPTEVEHISFESDEISMLREAEVIMITSDPENPLQSAVSFLEFELESKLLLFKRVVAHGFTEENENNLQVITCDDAGEKSLVIYLTKGNSTSVNTQGNCIIIIAKNEYDLVKVKDALLYRILGVIV